MKKTIFILALFLHASLCFGQGVKNLHAVFPPEKTPVHLTEANSYFIWSDSLLEGVPYHFKLVKVEKGQTPELALKDNAPVFEEEIDDYYFPYPWYAPAISEGDYAWEVRSGPTGAAAMSFFTMSVAAYMPIPVFTFNNYYTALREKLDAGYHCAVDRQLRIHYKELYRVPTGQGLRYKIYDMERNLLVDTDEQGNVILGNAPLVPIQYGENYLTINLHAILSPYTEYFYILEVRNAKKETHYLRFVWVRSNPFVFR
jgi:hypothetical protein